MPSSGTPKAAEWLVLYTIHIVLVLIPKWKWSSSEDTGSSILLATNSKLIGIIKLAISHQIKHESLQKIDQTIVNYRQDLIKYWGDQIKSKPTLHFSQHLTDIIRLYGPPSIFSFWSGERVNHIMTLIKKNKNSQKADHFKFFNYFIVLIFNFIQFTAQGSLTSHF